jgi:hypothetical protein
VSLCTVVFNSRCLAFLADTSYGLGVRRLIIRILESTCHGGMLEKLFFKSQEGLELEFRKYLQRSLVKTELIFCRKVNSPFI